MTLAIGYALGLLLAYVAGVLIGLVVAWREKRLQDAASDLEPASTRSEVAAEGNDAGSEAA